MFQKTRYNQLRFLFLSLMIRRGKLTARKLATVLGNYARYFLRRSRAAAYPSILIPEVTNRCNLRCRNCRTEADVLVDYLDPQGAPIAMGSMSYALYESMIEEAGPHLLAVVLYVSGESLVHREIRRMVSKATERGVATILSTNGMLLDEPTSADLIGAGLDYLKIVISGFTQETYEQVHRGGRIETVLRNVSALAGIRRRLGSPMIIVVDYLLFPHNRHEEEAARSFCREQGVLFNARVGFTVEEDTPGKVLPSEEQPPGSARLCDWLWTIMTVGWQGRVLACANYTFTGRPEVMGHLGEGTTIREIWNGPKFRAFRSEHLKRGRGAYPLCRTCHYEGIKFQY